MNEKSRKVPHPSSRDAHDDDPVDSEKQEEPSFAPMSCELSQAVKVLVNIEQFGGYLAKTAQSQATRLVEAQSGLVRAVASVRDLAGAAASVTKKIQVGSLAPGDDVHAAASGVILVARVLRQLNEFSKNTTTAVESQAASTRALTEMVGEVAKASISLAGKLRSLAREARAALPALGNKDLVEAELRWLTQELETVVAEFRHGSESTDGAAAFAPPEFSAKVQLPN